MAMSFRDMTIRYGVVTADPMATVMDRLKTARRMCVCLLRVVQRTPGEDIRNCFPSSCRRRPRPIQKFAWIVFIRAGDRVRRRAP